VLEKGELVGLLDEWDLLQAVTPNKANFAHLVRGVMTTTLETCDASADVSALLPLFERNLVPIITHDGKFEGLITKIDYLNYLRRRNS
jgi:cystathionine beta-synthase